MAETVTYCLKNRNPHTPTLHCATKLHKVPPDKMRPISSNIDAPCERIAKWLVKEFSKLTPPESFSVKNGADFVSKMKNVKLRRNEIMVSYDVDSVEESLVLLRKWLKSQGTAEPYIDMYMDLTKMCAWNKIILCLEKKNLNNDTEQPWVTRYQVS